jgi:hypothetical protein
MTYLKDLIERIGKALGIKTKTPAAGESASPSKLVSAPVSAEDSSKPGAVG